MKNMSLSSRLLWASALTFVVFFSAAILVFYRSQNRLTEQEMDRLLKSESLTISSLVNTNFYGDMDFEFSDQFLPLYESSQISSFFIFYSKDGQILRKSSNAPYALCDPHKAFRFEQFEEGNFRILSYVFDVQPEEGHVLPPNSTIPRLCLVVGNDEGPYRELVRKTILSNMPYLIGIFTAALFFLQLIIRTLTADLSNLSQTLANSNFSSTRSFPKLPLSKTIEVGTIVEKLNLVHRQATQVYEEALLFMARAAHQLKTPVAAIQATYDVLVRKERSRDELLEGLGDIQVGIRQMSQLTLKLISSTRIKFESKPELVPIDLKRFFEDQKKLFQYRAALKNISWIVENSSPSIILADEYLITEIFGNLIENALLYTPAHSSLRISWLREIGTMTIYLSDEGPGFPPEIVEHLFEPFHRGDERHVGGSGLGLSIVKNAIDMLEASIELIKSGKDGSTLRIKFNSPE